MRQLILICLLAIAFSLQGQVSYKRTVIEPVTKGVKINPLEIEEGFYQSLNYISPPNHIQSEVELAKEASVMRFPRQEAIRVSTRGLADPPTIEKGFRSANAASTPTDNTLAVGRDGTNVSGVNRAIHFADKDGQLLRVFSLSSFSQGTPANQNQFDPRAIYDPEADKYCIAWLAGNSSTTSSILMAFSSSSDVTEEWTVYSLDGNPFGTTVWTDYPMLSLTKDAVILTVNHIRDSEPWETGFEETVVYQIDKTKAYNGEAELDAVLYSDIQFNNKSIRNLHPVKSADEILEADQYFLSNRNFDVVNDTFFVLRLASTLADPQGGLEVDFRITSLPYGVPPNGDQPSIGADLQTNDARVLDAFRLDEQIQFVGNTMDMATGRAAIYHGFIDNLSTGMNLYTTLLTHPTRDLAYPGIAWTGIEADEPDAIVVAQHSSSEEFAGFSTVYIDEAGECSDWVDILEGGGYVRGNGNTVRWGDYIGCQRQYDLPGVVWVSSMATNSVGVPINYNALLTEPNSQFSGTASVISNNFKVSVAPNPTSDRVTIAMSITKKERLRIAIYDMQGREVTELFNDKAKKIGTLEYSFDISSLNTGMYLFTATLGNEEIVSQKIVKN